MKTWLIPAVLLTVVLGLSLLNSVYLSNQCDAWTSQLQKAEQAAAAEDWAAAAEHLDEFRASWDKRQTYLHILIVHEELDNAQSLLERCSVLAQEADSVEFRGGIAELISQLRLLNEMEKLSIKNVL
jgi:thioredoxin-like negative regulator of GroEL